MRLYLLCQHPADNFVEFIAGSLGTRIGRPVNAETGPLCLCLSVCLSVSVSVSLSQSLSLSLCLSLSLSLSLPACLSVCLSVCLSLFCDLFNRSIDTGIFPEEWKIVKVTPVHKGKEKFEQNNYRPISVIPIISKMFEKLVFNQLLLFNK